MFSFVHRIVSSGEIVRTCNDTRIACRQSTLFSTDHLQKSFGFGVGSREGGDDEGVVQVSLARNEAGVEKEHFYSVASSSYS